MFKFQYYKGNIKESLPIGWVTIEQFIQANKHPKQSSIELFESIAEAEKEGNLKLKASLKEKLFSFTPCVQLNGNRRYSNIVNFTGLLVLDFDHIENAPDFKEYLFNEYDYIYLCWLSPSKRGVKALVKIPKVQDVDSFKAYYFGISAEMQQYNGFDGSGQNCVLPLFQSNDTEMLVRDYPKLFTVRGFKKDNFITSKATVTPNLEGKKEQLILKIINTGIDKITDNGHPQLRSICIAVGGYVANNYIDLNNAIDIIFNRIECNRYLQKGIEGYKRTAKWAVNIGTSKPLSI
jgi:hypothetical protein